MIAMVYGFLHRFSLRMRIVGVWSARFVSRAFVSLAAGAVALLGMLFLGVLMGYSGYKADLAWLQEAGQTVIALGGMIACVVLAVFYLKAVGFTHVLAAIDEILGRITFGRVKNLFSHETGKDIRHELLNIFAWIAAFCAYAVIFPVYKTLLSIPVAIILATFFAMASSKHWTFLETRIGRIVVFIALVGAFLFHTANICVAGAMSKYVSQRGDIAAARFNAWIAEDDGREDILEERVSYEEAKGVAQMAEYRRLSKRQIALSRSGHEDSLEWKRNARRMRELENGPREEVVVNNTTTDSANPASPATFEIGGIHKLTGWISSHWGWLLIWGLVSFLLILFIVGLMSRQRWLAIFALSSLLFLGFLGVGSWILGHTKLQSASVVMTQPRTVPSKTPELQVRRAKCRPGLRAKLEDIERNLDALAAQ